MSEQAPHKDEVISERTWDEFRESGMLWFANRILHVFGWAIVVEHDDDTCTVRGYPARTVWRGFPPDSEDRGFRRVTRWMAEHAEALVSEVEVDDE